MEASVYITILCVLIALFCCSSNGENVYRMTVVTSNVHFAGTDDDVSITLHGLKGFSQDVYSGVGTNVFEQNTETTATMTTEKALGDLTSCQVERYGTDDWSLSYIVIVDESSNKIYICNFNRWIYSDIASTTAIFEGCSSSKIGKHCQLNCNCKYQYQTYNNYCYNNGTCKQGSRCESSWFGSTCQKKEVPYYNVRRKDKQAVYIVHLKDGYKNTGVLFRDTDPYVSVAMSTNSGLEHNFIIANSDIFAYNTTKYQICRSSDDNLYYKGEALSMVCQNFTYSQGWHTFTTSFNDERKYVSLKAFGYVPLNIGELTFGACNLGTYGDDCSSICDNCINRNCNYSGHCLDGCISGETGPVCSDCPKNCVCNPNSGICTICEKGWFGDICNLKCNSNCHDNECEKTSGKCNSCSPGFFKETCEAKCPFRCLSCHRELGTCNSCSEHFRGSNCTVCKDGYFGSNCDQKCAQNCSKCTDSESCTQCKPGWFGSTCSCEEECLNPCDKTAGKCMIDSTVALPKLTTTGMSNCRIDNCKVCSVDNTTCLECKIGFTGVNCEASCSRGCIDSGCDRSTAECLRGCFQGFKGPLCNQACNLGTYGEDCSCICDHCINLNCNYSGQCLEGHISGVTGPLCSVCPKNCICNRTGICVSCVKGWFGDNCDSQCNPNCQNEECDKSSGKCNFCSPGFFKETCKARCPSPRCLSCHQESGICNYCSGQFQGRNCSLCKDGYFGSNCDQKCAQNCSKCTNLESCFQCKPGWFGSTCSCEEECLNPCDKTAGKCMIDSTVALPKLTTTGMSNCRIDNCKVCSVDNTTCLECKIGFTGVNCEASCSRGCIYSGCDRSTAECLWGCYQGFKGPLCNQANQDNNDSIFIIASVAAVACMILLMAILVLFVKVLKRRKHKLRRQTTRQNLQAQKFSDLRKNAEISDSQNQSAQAPVTASLITKSKNLALADVYEEIDKVSLDDKAQKITNQTDYYSLDKVNSIPVDSLWEKNQEKKHKDLFDEEFTALKNRVLESYEEAVKSTNVSKNKYKGIYPYDHNRIVLDPEPGVSESDYINASYINGYSADKFYIASMGPFNDVTVIDIWRMIWQTNVKKIVMLTNLTEEGKEQCKQYWPEVDQLGTYGKIKVTCTQKHVLANYTLRSFDLWKDNKKSKTVLHFQLTIWPDRGVPKNVASVVEFRNKVRNATTSQEGPMLIHCSAVIGRTCAYLALDYLIEQGESTKSVDVIDCVISLRYQRAKAVQTSEQYEFIHDALAEALNAGRSSVPTDQFHSYYRDLKTKNKITGKSKLQEQYELLVKLSPTFDDENFATAKLKVNKTKHRYSYICSADDYRIYLQPLTSSNLENLENDYINAIFLPAYKEHNAFLLTEMPLPNTIEAFWHMVFQENCSSIIMLNDIKKDKTFGTYWPVQSKEVEFGPVQVTLLEKEGENGPFDTLTLKALYNTGTQVEEKIVKQFQCKFWPGDAMCPPKPHPMLEMMESVMAWQRQTGNQPTIVHCMNGANQSGLYCALFTIIERLRTEHDVSVFQTILQLRTRRGQIVPNKDQLEFCYETVLAYLDSFNMYSNFD